MMARKVVQATTQTLAAGSKPKAVRVDLDPRVHRMLRLEAAKADTSMASLSRLILAQELDRLQRLQ